MADAFIKIYNKMLNWEWYDDINTKVVFLHCLLKANWKSGSWHGINYDAGQFITSLSTLAKETKLSVRQVRVALNHLKLTGEVTDKRQANCRIITVVKWNEYQCYDRPNDIPVTDQRQTCDKPVTTDKEIKNIRKEEEKNNKKKIIKEKPVRHQYGYYKNVLLSDEDMEKLKREFPKDYQDRIERVSEYCKSKGKSYSDYLATIRSWARKENNGRSGHDVRRNEEDDKELDEAVERFLAGDYEDEPLF